MEKSVRYVKESNVFCIHVRDEGHQLNWKDARLIHIYERKMLAFPNSSTLTTLGT